MSPPFYNIFEKKNVQISLKIIVGALQPQAKSHLRTMAALHYDICQSYKLV